MNSEVSDIQIFGVLTVYVELRTVWCLTHTVCGCALEGASVLHTHRCDVDMADDISVRWDVLTNNKPDNTKLHIKLTTFTRTKFIHWNSYRTDLTSHFEEERNRPKSTWCLELDFRKTHTSMKPMAPAVSFVLWNGTLFAVEYLKTLLLYLTLCL